MEKHRTALGALFLVNGLLGVIGILIVAAIFGLGGFAVQQAAAHDPNVPAFVPFIPAAVGLGIVGMIALFSIPCLVVAWGLFKDRPWSKLMALIMGILNLMAFPLGTVTGGYAIWYFVQPESTQSNVREVTGY